jgi:hypothetical protein
VGDVDECHFTRETLAVVNLTRGHVHVSANSAETGRSLESCMKRRLSI